MKVTDAEGIVYVVDQNDKYLVILRSEREIPQELLDELHKDLHEWYFSPSKFFVINFPDAVDLEFQKVGLE